MSSGLPQSPILNTGALSRLFDKTTNSYKYLFFLALLNILKQRQFASDKPITFWELASEMLVLAWYPHAYFRLSFGKQDQVVTLLQRLGLAEPADGISPGGQVEEVRTSVHQRLDNDAVASLMRWVPYRLLRAFFQADTRGMKDSQVNATIAQLSRSKFATAKPLYMIDDEAQQIWLHPDWATYLRTHSGIVEGWAYWHWLQYMQTRNPNAPAVGQKLLPPQRRDALTWQKDAWASVIEQAPIHCIYSGEALSSDNFVLDHFLPWSFIVHDRIWNLVPTLSHANSSKGHAVPTPDHIELLVEQHHTALRIWHDNESTATWHDRVEPYLVDLRMAESHLLDRSSLKQAYHQTVGPMISLAKAQGFPADWHY